MDVFNATPLFDALVTSATVKPEAELHLKEFPTSSIGKQPHLPIKKPSTPHDTSKLPATLHFLQQVG